MTQLDSKKVQNTAGTIISAKSNPQSRRSPGRAHHHPPPALPLPLPGRGPPPGRAGRHRQPEGVRRSRRIPALPLPGSVLLDAGGGRARVLHASQGQCRWAFARGLYSDNEEDAPRACWYINKVYMIKYKVNRCMVQLYSPSFLRRDFYLMQRCSLI